MLNKDLETCYEMTSTIQGFIGHEVWTFFSSSICVICITHTGYAF